MPSQGDRRLSDSAAGELAEVPLDLFPTLAGMATNPAAANAKAAKAHAFVVERQKHTIRGLKSQFGE